MCTDSNIPEDQVVQVSSAITAETVQKVASLARLELGSEEQVQVLGQMGRILAHFEQISNIETETTEAACHPYEIGNKLRDDIVLPGLSSEILTGLSVSRKDGYLQVPRTVE